MTTAMSEEYKLVARPGEIPFARGLEGVITAESTKSYVDGIGGKLFYHGIPIEVLAERSTFEEVVFLLLYDRLPTRGELAAFQERMAAEREISDFVYQLVAARAGMPRAHSMAVLRSAVSCLSGFDAAAESDADADQEQEAVRIVSQMATVVAAIGRARAGLPAVRPRRDLSHAANLLWMLTGRDPDPYEARVMDLLLILHADHECNASTFAVVVVKSTLADMYSAVVAGIGALKGPLHGGANEDVMRMIKEIGAPERARAWAEEAIAQKRKIPGFGHRVYKTMDPRARILRQYAEEMARRAGTGRWLQIADALQATIQERLGAKGIWPNVDFYSGIVMASMGIPEELFTPVFAVSRAAGWVAHALEQAKDNRIYRPRFVYVGPEEAPYVPLEDREAPGPGPREGTGPAESQEKPVGMEKPDARKRQQAEGPARERERKFA